MKRYFSLLLVALMATVSFAACSQQGGQALPNITTQAASASRDTSSDGSRVHSMLNCSGGPDACVTNPNGGGGNLDTDDYSGGGHGCPEVVVHGRMRPMCPSIDGPVGGDDNGDIVATAPPAVGLTCDNSPVALGTSNVPGGTSGAATSVVNF